jgi:endonuclease YncB( thermonuclease family)
MIALARIGFYAVPRMMLLTLRSITLPRRGGTLLATLAAFAADLTAGALLAPADAGRSADRAALVLARAAPASPLHTGHPAEVLRVIDGDTFEARVRVWPGMDITTRVRLRGIDAPELHARCADEQAKALAARDALTRILAQGAVGIARIGQDKYGGRVDADVSTAVTADVSAAMLEGGFARAYNGGRRGSWCG